MSSLERIKADAYDLTPEEQHALATAIASNVGYELKPESGAEPEAEPMVPLRLIEQLERAQLEILALQLWREEHPRSVMGWYETMPAIRAHFRTQAHEIMQGREPKSWKR